MLRSINCSADQEIKIDIRHIHGKNHGKKHENQRFLSRIISFIDCGVSMSVVSSRVDWLNILLWLAGCHFSYLEKKEKTCVPLSILIRKMNDETCKLKLYWCYWYDMIPFGIIMDQSEHKISVLCMEHHI
jgi:hypothetical protein